MSSWPFSSTLKYRCDRQGPWQLFCGPEVVSEHTEMAEQMIEKARHDVVESLHQLGTTLLYVSYCVRKR